MGAGQITHSERKAEGARDQLLRALGRAKSRMTQVMSMFQSHRRGIDRSRLAAEARPTMRAASSPIGQSLQSAGYARQVLLQLARDEEERAEDRDTHAFHEPIIEHRRHPNLFRSACQRSVS